MRAPRDSRVVANLISGAGTSATVETLQRAASPLSRITGSAFSNAVRNMIFLSPRPDLGSTPPAFAAPRSDLRRSPELRLAPTVRAPSRAAHRTGAPRRRAVAWSSFPPSCAPCSGDSLAIGAPRIGDGAMAYTLAEAAQAAGRGKTTLLRMIRSGRLSARRDPGTGGLMVAAG